MSGPLLVTQAMSPTECLMIQLTLQIYFSSILSQSFLYSLFFFKNKSQKWIKATLAKSMVIYTKIFCHLLLNTAVHCVSFSAAICFLFILLVNFILDLLLLMYNMILNRPKRSTIDAFSPPSSWLKKITNVLLPAESVMKVLIRSNNQYAFYTAVGVYISKAVNCIF